MASIKNLKKDIDFLVSDLQTSLFIVNAVKELSTEQPETVAGKVNTFRATYLQKARKPEIAVAKSDKAAYAKATKAAYKQLRIDLFKEFGALSDEITALAK